MQDRPMKNIYLLLLLLFLIHSIHAQFYIVKTDDHYTNVRGEFNKIINTVAPGTIVAETMPDFEWADYDKSIFTTYTKEKKVYAGNITIDQIKYILTGIPEEEYYKYRLKNTYYQ